MAQSAADLLGVAPASDEVGAVGVPQVVEADARQACRPHQPLEALSHGVGMQRGTVDLGEHEVEVGVAGPDGKPGLELPAPVRPQDARRLGVEVDAASAVVGLGALHEGRGMVDDAQLPSYGEAGAV